MKVGFLGPKGSFSELATKSLAFGMDCQFVIYASLDELQEAFFVNEIDVIVMPVFNSKEGQLKSPRAGRKYIERFLDYKKSHGSFHIIAEKFLKLNFCLL